MAELRRIVVAPRSADRLAAALEWLAALPPGAEALLVAANWEGADDLLRELAAARGALFGVHRLTFNLLAGLIAAPDLAAARLVPAGGLAAEAVAARAVYRLAATGRLGHFESVGDRPGFPGAVARTLEELRLAAVAPGPALEAIERVGPPLAAMLAQFEAELREASLTDRAGTIAAATAAVAVAHGGGADAPPPRFTGLPTLLLDLEVASRAERDFIAALAARAPKLLATAPTGDGRSARLLQEALGVNAGGGCKRGAARDSLARLQDHLFSDTAPDAAPLDDTITILSAPGESRECIEIAREIQAQARRGVPFDRIAIFLHSPAQYTASLEEALRRASVPAYFARGAARPEPGGRALLVLLACAAERLSARRWAEYVSLAQVPDPPGGFASGRQEHPEGGGRDLSEAFIPPDTELAPGALAADFEARAPGGAGAARLIELPADAGPQSLKDDPVPVVEGTLRAPWRWEQLLVDAAVIGTSAQRWEKRLDGLLHELGLRRDELAEDDLRAAIIGRQLVDLAHLREVALPQIAALAALPARATWGEWLAHLRALVHLAVRDAEPVLAALAELEPMAPVGPVDLDEVRLVLADRLGELTRRPPRRRYGAVFVAPAGAARGLAFEVVFVPGLSEKIFPGKLVEDPILPDPARRALQADLVVQSERVAAERLALHLAVGAARARLFISYPRLDIDQGRPRVPSFYVLEVLRAAEGRLPGFDELKRRAAAVRDLRLGWPAPAQAGQAIDDAEYDLASLEKLLEADPQATIGTANYLLQANAHLGRALRARARRWIRRWTPADGLVDPEPFAREVLARHQFGARSYSPTALQNFAACPYRFFLQAVHRLAPREEPEAIEAIDPLTRGALFHEVQFDLLSALRDESALPVTPDNLEHALGQMEQILAVVAERYREELAPAIERVWQEGIALIRADLREWLRRAAHDGGGWSPDRFELSFGLSGRAQADPASLPEPVETAGGLRLRGSIDLIERHACGVLRVTDHKTGKAWAKKGVAVGGGEILQPLLYALAAEAILKEPVESGRLYYCSSAGGYEERVVALEAESRAAIARVIGIISGALAQGFLPAAPAPDKCRFCDYLVVCGPREELRTRRKPAARIAELERMRGMR